MGMENDHVVQARARAAAGDLSGALEAINLELSRKGPDPSLRIFRARIKQSLGHLHDALVDIRAVDRGSVSARFLAFRAELEETARRLPAALETLTRAIRIEPRDPSLRGRRAFIRQSLGDTAGARQDLEYALKAQPESGELLYHLASLTQFDADTPVFDALTKARRSAKTGSSAAFHLDFALARATDQRGEIAQSFTHLQAANAAVRAAYPFDVTQRQALVDRYQKVFRDFDPSAFWSEGSSMFSPIFVTGMPRSGTTLVEQILSSHGAVDAAGETGVFFKGVQAHVGDPMTAARRKLALSSSAFAKAGQVFADTMGKLVDHDTPHLTDKSLQTWMYLGLVLAALPNAKIVVVERQPEATALSIYRHLFRPGKQLFSYDLKDVATYQRSFDAMLGFWKEKCGGMFSTIRYEDLVQDPTVQTRKLISNMGLDWDEACLKPEENARAVMTLSASEVRQPIHTKSVEAWKAYAAYLPET